MDEAAPVAAGDVARASRPRVGISQVLSHPLLLLVVGAAISALIVPMLTQRWQDHQRALDVQTQLVSEMAAAVTAEHSMLSSLDSAGLNASSGADLAELARQYFPLHRAATTWQVRQAEVGAKLRAYYRRTSIPAKWEALTEALGELYFVENYRIWSVRTDIKGRVPSEREWRDVKSEMARSLPHWVANQTAKRFAGSFAPPVSTSLERTLKVDELDGVRPGFEAVADLRDALIQQVLDTAPKI